MVLANMCRMTLRLTRDALAHLTLRLRVNSIQLELIIVALPGTVLTVVTH